MVDDKPNMAGMPPPSQKLVLPAPNDAYSPPDQYTQRGHVSERLVAIKHTSVVPPAVPPPTMPPLTKIRNWRNDPAYMVLLIAICMVLVAGIIFAVVASNLFFQGISLGGTAAAPTVGAALQGTVDTNPHFPTPSGNQGGTASSQPPKTGTTIVIPSSPTAGPTAQSSPTQGPNGQLTVQIVDIQSPIDNNNIDPVTVMTSEPGVRVKLLITYNASPGFASVGPQTTDDNGNATLDWNVFVNAFGGSNHVTAHVMAMARDQNGQEATSQVMIVQINVKGGVGG